MPLTIYQASVPVFQRALQGLSNCLDKTVAQFEARKVDPDILIGYRLYPDMFPFSKQVQQSTVHATAGPARLAGIDAPKFEDNDASFADLKARLGKALDFLGTVDAAKMNGAEDREIKFMMGGNERKFTGYSYLFTHALPNFYFHVSTAYDILRHNGVELGKRDFLNNQ